jgi:hypothetical protein
MRLSVHSRSNRARRGSALVMIMVLMIALAGLSAAMITLTNTSHVENRVSKQEIAAQAVAEAGIHLAYRSLAAGGNGAIGSPNNQANYDGANYYVTQTNGANSTVTLTSTAETRGGESTVALCLRLATTPLFRWAAFGDDGVHMDSNAFTDSYNSLNGTYAAQATNGSGSSLHAATEGDIGSNASILMEQNSKVFGDASPGASNTATVMGNAQLSGTSTPATAPVEMAPIVLPAVAASGPLIVAKGASVTIGPGTVHYTSLVANTGSTINVVGPMTLICDSFQLRSNTKLLVNGTLGDVELYVVNDFLLNSNSMMRSTTYAPQHLQISLLSDNVIDPDIDVDFDPDNLTFDSNAKIYGTIYAPNATVEIDSNFELFGSLVAREVDLNSNCKIHFDEALLVNGPMGTPVYQRVAWQVMD